MSKIVKNWITAGVLLALFAVTQMFCAGTLNGIEDVLPEAVEVRFSDPSIMMAESGALPRVSLILVGAQSEEARSLIATPDGRREEATTVYISQDLGQLLPMEFVVGGWPFEDNQAAISESLASSLFQETAFEERFITIDGRVYAVSGVFCEPDYVRALADVPIAAYVRSSQIADEMPIAVLYLTDSEGYHAQYIIQRASQYFSQPLDGEVHDYRDMLSLARAVRYLPVLFCALFLSVLLLLAAAKQFQTAYAAQGEAASRRALRVCAAALVTAGALAGLSLMLEQLAIPGSYLPQNSIFDLKFYSDSIRAFFERMNQPGAVMYGRYFGERIKVLSMTGALSVLPFCAASIVAFVTVFRKAGSYSSPEVKDKKHEVTAEYQ